MGEKNFSTVVHWRSKSFVLLCSWRFVSSPPFRHSAVVVCKIEAGSPLSESFDEDHDMFFREPKNEFIRSKQFNQKSNPAKEAQEIPLQGSRLGIV